MDLNSAQIFVRVVCLGSFTKAARELGLPNSTVSDRISDLETALGVRLLTRTTRKLHLTDAGSIFFQTAEQAVAALIGAGEKASAFQKQPSGVLRITVPVEFDLSSISDIAAAYLDRFPDVRIEFLLTDRVVDLVGEGVDIAIRAGPVEHSNLSTKTLGLGGFVLVASPAYLDNAPKIREPGDLASHKCLVILAEKDPSGAAIWTLKSKDDHRVRIEPRARVSSTSVGAIKHLVLIGQGVALMPPFLVRDDIAAGRMIHILPAWSTTPQPIYLVYTHDRNLSPKVREMLPLLEPRLHQIFQAPSSNRPAGR